MKILSRHSAWTWIGILATALGAAPALADGGGAGANGNVVADPVTAALVDATLRQPDVAAAVHAGAATGNAQATPPAGPPQMITIVPRAPAPVPGAPAPQPSIPDPRSDRHFGIDAHVGVPLGVGAEFRYTIVAPVTVGAAVDTTGATVAVTAEATVNILPIFMHSHWTPTVTVGFTHIRFTGLADSAIQAFNPYLSQENAHVNMAGMWMNAVSVMGGVDYVSDGGFHFNVSAGRIMQVGDSGGGGDNGTVLRGFYSYMVQIALGYQF